MMKKISLILMVLVMMLSGCGAIREVPVQTITKVVVKDSLVVMNDTVEVEIPREVVKEIVPEMDTSYLSTAFARSTAYVDTSSRQIHHTLEQSGIIVEPVQMKCHLTYKDRYLTREIPIEVPVPYTPKWCWILLIVNISIIALIAGKKLSKFII